MKKELLKVENLKKYFTPHKGIIEAIKKSDNEKVVKALDGLSFTLYEGETLALIGESGCGKTTLGKTIMKLENATSGNILFEGSSIINIDKKEELRYRRNVQMIFQDPYASMNPRFKIRDVVAEPLYIHSIEYSEDKILKALELVKVVPATDFIDRYPHMLSGGQRQRIATARTLILEPKLIIADEPVSMIDLSTRAEILHTMKEIKNQMSLSYLYITHDLSTARYFADRIAVMYLGKIVEIGLSSEIIDSPKHPYTKALIQAVPKMKTGQVDKIKTIDILGDIPSPTNIPQGCRFNTRCPYAMDDCRVVEPRERNISDTHKVNCFLV